MSELLKMEQVRGGYAEVDVLQGVVLEVREQEVVAIVGPNGAGKSTAMKAILGMLAVRGGRIRFDGEDITGWSADRVVQRGICYVPQVSNVFAEMTVEENLEMGAFLKKKRDLSAEFEHVYALFPDLRSRRKSLAGDLSGGQRQMVAMGRALMLQPKLLLLDEPTAGLSPKYRSQIFQIIRDVCAAGISILLVEQHAKQALEFSDRGYVMAMGTTRHQGTGSDLLDDPEVAHSFLGAS